MWPFPPVCASPKYPKIGSGRSLKPSVGLPPELDTCCIANVAGIILLLGVSTASCIACSPPCRRPWCLSPRARRVSAVLYFCFTQRTRTAARLSCFFFLWVVRLAFSSSWVSCWVSFWGCPRCGRLRGIGMGWTSPWGIREMPASSSPCAWIVYLGFSSASFSWVTSSSLVVEDDDFFALMWSPPLCFSFNLLSRSPERAASEGLVAHVVAVSCCVSGWSFQWDGTGGGYWFQEGDSFASRGKMASGTWGTISLVLGCF